MTDITYVATDAATATPKRRSVFARLFDALTEARLAQARREIAWHIHLVPAEQRERLRRELARDREPQV